MRLREAAGGRGDTILYENYTRGPKAAGAGTTERLPNTWLLSATRVNELLVGSHTLVGLPDLCPHPNPPPLAGEGAN